ncbi:MAG TPA: ribosome recycling factor [Saprospiraceae bacterium]|nr:ribosome recycling factor [Saprospiraceae bacterium]MCC6688676.1 ribosome recycling factor [Saprospiraceae bacterium]HMW74152.1 ribosome recycling factor [Saprospiraceae bacterium]HMX82427.1 ribosome recycling factor [Saprospiraceae bacterium]HMX85281.1 ribosome recycling factor [Saprospiraceae bacterium]
MTEQEIQIITQKAKNSMDHSLDHLQKELSKLRTGKASTTMLEGILVDYYGSPTLLNQVANVATSDARTISIQPWEKKMLSHIEKAIFEANLGVTPQNDGEVIRIIIPPLTEDRRKDLVKQAKHLGEESKVGLRNARRDAMEVFKKAIKDGLSEDIGKRKEEETQKMLNSYVEKIDTIVSAKEKEIMTV